MATRKKKKEKSIATGLAVAGVGLAFLMGKGGTSTPTGKALTAWMRNTNSGTLIIVKDAYAGEQTDTLQGNTLFISDSSEYRMGGFRTGTTYYVYGQEETSRVSAVEFGTIDDISSDGEVHPGNNSTFFVSVNGSLVGTTAVLPSTTLQLSAFNLIATIEFVEAT